MKLLIKQRVFALSDTYDVYDENEQVKYFVKAKAFSLGHQITIYDQNDEEIGKIKQKVWHFLPTFIIEINGQELGYVRKALSLFKPKYEIDFNGLPEQFVLKCNHNSGYGMLICKDKGKIDIVLKCKCVKQVEILKYEAEIVTAKCRNVLFLDF